jgi:23S rRNA pseudouridine1911/1915/1917 synthase
MKNTQKLNIIYEDDDILVINKPAGLIVESGAGVKEETLVDLVRKYLSSRGGDIKRLGKRAGLVHRLDKDTSGLMVIAKKKETQEFLQTQIKERKVLKKYLALVYGKLPPEGKIILPIGRHKIRRDKMTVTFLGRGREAETNYKVKKIYHYKGYILTMVEAQIKTGRTHQIRVHFSYYGHPIIGDSVYGNKITQQIAENLGLTRQFLHAAVLGFTHPKTGEWVEFKSELPEDLKKAVESIY